MTRRILLFWSVFLFLAVTLSLESRCGLAREREILDLQGTWQFRLDPQNVGLAERWFAQDLPDKIRLPGMLQAQGYGDPPGPESKWLAGIGLQRARDPQFAEYFQQGKFLSPFFLTPPRHYVGPAWYQRTLQIPQHWAGLHITLTLERVHWESRLWVDATEVGRQDSLATPHVYDLSRHLPPGSHRVTIRVDNSYIIPVGSSAHSVSDETQGNWNGIVGQLRMQATAPVWVEDVQVYPQVKEKAVEVELIFGNISGQAVQTQVSLQAQEHAQEHDEGDAPRTSPHTAAGPGLPQNNPAQMAQSYQALVTPIHIDAGGGKAKIKYYLGDKSQTWDEFAARLYDLQIDLTAADREDPPAKPGEQRHFDSRIVSFGLRDLEIRDTQFALNGRPIFLRGTLECCIFPLTGHPPMDVQSWKRILTVARQHGLNHLRFHSWCPPEAAFLAADEMGFYYQVECSCWTSFGEGGPQDAFVFAEAERIRQAYGNHPSFVLLVASNEPGGNAAKRDAFLSHWIEVQRAADPRRCYSAGSGWPQLEANQFHIQAQTRLQNWGPLQLNKAPQTWDDYREYIQKLGKPTISHEIGQWCAYPNVVSEPEKYTGFFRGSNVEVFRDILMKKGMWDQAADFVRASGRFQVALYKQEIESALRTPGMAGFQLLDLHDFPGQGTAPVGVLDAFWEGKGYSTPEEYRRFCNSTVLLARLKKRVFTADESVEFRVDVAHYGPSDLQNVVLAWELRANSQVVASGKQPPRDFPSGQLTEGQTQTVQLENLKTPCSLSLVTRLEGAPFENDWTIWVYPPSIAAPPQESVNFTANPDQAWNWAQQGKSVLLIPEQQRIAGDTLGTFQPIFWNRVTFPSQKVHMLGILCDPQHPALEHFPTSFHADWQWQQLLDACKPTVLDGLPATLKPIVQGIDDWCEARKLGLIWEAKLGPGRVLVCSIDILSDLPRRIVARQLRASLLRYMASPAFQPSTSLTKEQWNALWREPRLLEKLGAGASTDSFEPNYGPDQAIDGDLRTMWHSAWNPQPSPLPHELVLDLRQEVMLRGLRVWPRQDGNPNGQIADYEICVSRDGHDWTKAAEGTWDAKPIERVIRFGQPIAARLVKIVSRREIHGQQFTSIAEIDVIAEPDRSAEQHSGE